MKSYIAFTKKEFCESLRTYKLFIMLAVFFLFGMMNPVTAKLTPEILVKFMPEGMKATIPEPTALDSWMQFFKNIPQMGLIVLVIVFSGIMANEFNRGTLINMLTKGLSRSVVILSKFTMATAVWTISYVLCFGVSYIYTDYFWKVDNVTTVLFAVFCLWLFGILLIAAELLGSVLFNSSYGCLLVTGGFIVILFLINIVPKLQKYNPIGLASKNIALITGEMSVSDFAIPITICCIIVIGFVTSTIAIFNKKQI